MDLRLRRQQHVQQAGLVLTKAQVVFLARAQVGQRGEPRQPVLGQHPERSIAQPHHGLAAAQRGQQVRKLGAGAAVIHLAAQFEPVDATGDFHTRGGGGAECLAIGLHVPARAKQLAHGARHGFGIQGPAHASRAESGRAQLFVRGGLGRGVADQKDALPRHPDTTTGNRVRQPAGTVIEERLADELLFAPRATRLADAQGGARHAVTFLETQRFVQVQPRQVRGVQQRGEDFVALAVGERDAPDGEQLLDPGVGALVLQERDPAARDDEPAAQNQHGLGERHALLAAHQRPHDGPLITIVLANLQQQAPCFALVPLERRELMQVISAQRQPAGGGRARNHLERQRMRQRFTRGRSVGGGVVEGECVGPAQQHGDDVGVHRIRQLPGPGMADAKVLPHGGLAVLFPAAREKIQHHGSSRARARRVHHVEQFEAVGPLRVGLAQLRGRLNLAEILLPGRGTRALGYRVEGRQPVRSTRSAARPARGRCAGSARIRRWAATGRGWPPQSPPTRACSVRSRRNRDMYRRPGGCRDCAHRAYR